MYRDAFEKLNDQLFLLKNRLQVEFDGEAGMDGGGLFKEFLNLFAKHAFDRVFSAVNGWSERLDDHASATGGMFKTHIIYVSVQWGGCFIFE